MVESEVGTEIRAEPLSQYKESLISKLLQKGVSSKDISEILRIPEQIVRKREKSMMKGAKP